MVILVDFSAELINYITEINRTVIIEKGNTLEIHWKIGHGKDGYLLYDLKHLQLRISVKQVFGSKVLTPQK